MLFVIIRNFHLNFGRESGIIGICHSQKSKSPSDNNLGRDEDSELQRAIEASLEDQEIFARNCRGVRAKRFSLRNNRFHGKGLALGKAKNSQRSAQEEARLAALKRFQGGSKKYQRKQSKGDQRKLKTQETILKIERELKKQQIVSASR